MARPPAPTTSMEDRTVVITGANSGIGLETAAALATAGARIVMGCRNADTAAAAVDEVRRRCGHDRVETRSLDLADLDHVRRFAASLSDLDRIDVLINNAGRSPQDFGGGGVGARNMVPFYETPDEALNTIIDTNLKGVWYMSKAAAPHMVKRKFGKIISVSTSAGNMIRAGNPIYGPGKAALEAMTRVWAQELKGTGIDANIILPGGASDTSFIKQEVVPGAVGERAAAGRLLPGDVIVPPAVWLCTDATNGVTGVRAIGKNWDKTAPSADEAFRKCLDPHVEVPQIM